MLSTIDYPSLLGAMWHVLDDATLFRAPTKSTVAIFILISFTTNICCARVAILTFIAAEAPARKKLSSKRHIFRVGHDKIDSAATEASKRRKNYL